MMFNQYPYINVNDLNLDYISSQIKIMMNEVTNFVSINAIKYADPIQWDITRQYEKNTVVIDPVTGTAYISVAPVPAGVALTRTEYWTVVFDLGSFVTRAAQNFTSRYESETTLTATFPTAMGEWLVWGDVLYKALTNITAGDSYVVGGNIEHFTVEDLYNEYLNTIANVLAMIGDLADLTTSDTSDIVHAINSVLADLNLTIGDLADLTTSDTSDIVHAINSVLDDLGLEIGDLDNLSTSDKSNLVNAINEVLTGVSDLIVHDITLNVPADYATVMDAVDFLKEKILGANITIKVADGSYTGEILNVSNMDLSNVSIIGNTTDPELCRIQVSGNQSAFYAHNSQIGLIDGFYIYSTERDSGHHWSGHPVGVFAQYNSMLTVGLSMVFDTCYYAIQSANSSNVIMKAGEQLTSGIVGGLTLANVIANRKTKNIIALYSGDVAYFAYNGASIYMTSAIAGASRDEDIDLGYGILAEHASAVRAFNCFCFYCSQGFGASDGASLIAHDSCFSWHNGQGFESKINGSMECIGANTYQNTDVGFQVKDNGMMLARNNYSDDEPSGFRAIRGGIIICDKINTVHDITGYGYYFDKYSLITEEQYMTGTTTGQVLIRSQKMYADALPVTGNWQVGDVIYNTDPSNDIFAWECVVAGVIGTWKTVKFSDAASVLRLTFSRPATPVNGDTIFDISRCKPTTYYNGYWYDPSHSFDDFAPVTPVVGSCYFNTGLGKPIWYNGSNWIDASGTVVTP